MKDMKRMKKAHLRRISATLACLMVGSVLAEAGTWRQTETTLAWLNGTNIVWQIVADPAQGKPYFHPLATPGGTVLTDLRPADHPWHRALWFSWKFINGLNYWEEDRKTGRSQACTELTGHGFEPQPDGSAAIRCSLSYHPWNAPAVMTEQRTVLVSPVTEAGFELNWTSEFSAVTNLILDRTPPHPDAKGVSWGGYAGLSLRLNPALKAWRFLNSESQTGENAPQAQPAAWLKFTAGPDAPALTVFDDPKTPRHPSPWYRQPSMPFFQPALLYREPLTLAAGEKLVLRYRILVTDHDQPRMKSKG